MKFLVLGAGNIGYAIAYYLSKIGNASTYIYDIDLQKSVEVVNDIPNVIVAYTVAQVAQPYYKSALTFGSGLHERLNIVDYLPDMSSFSCVISAMPAPLNISYCAAASRAGVPFIDLGGDVGVIKEQAKIKQGSLIIPNCGLAPGLVPMLGYELYKRATTSGNRAKNIKMYCGGISAALPSRDNKLGWSNTWSIDGLINEYRAPVYTLKKGRVRIRKALSGLEVVDIAGLGTFEAARTSGSLGSLFSLLEGKVNSLEYRTLRYPGHYNKVKVLLDLCEGADDVAKRIITRVCCKGLDLVIFKVDAESIGAQGYVKATNNLTAMQIATAIPTVAIAKMVVNGEISGCGFKMVEDINFDIFYQIISSLGLDVSFERRI